MTNLHTLLCKSHETAGDNMKSNHTPAPWMVTMNHSYHTYQIWDEDGNYPDSDEQELEANRSLISAAPALLEALQQWVAFAENNGGEEAYSFLAQSKALIASL